MSWTGGNSRAGAGPVYR